jgi:hypothetical protein
VKLGTRLYSPDEREDTALESMVNGTIGGDSYLAMPTVETRRAVLAVQLGEFPEHIPANAVAAWVASDLALEDGSQVNSWVDRIAGLVAVSFGVAPILDAEGINGGPSVFFGADGVLEYAAANAVSTALSGSVFAIVQFPSLPASAQAIWASTNTSFVNNAFVLTGRINHDGILIEQDNGFSGKDELQGNTGPLPDIDVACLIEWQSDGSSYAIVLDDDNVPLDVLQGANTGDWFGDTTNRGNFTIGGGKTTGGSGAYLGGRIQAVIVCDGPTSDADRAGLRTWAGVS